MPVDALYAEAVIPPGRVPITDRTSPACGLVSTMVADTSVVLSTSVMVSVVEAIGVGAAFST